MIRKCTGQCQEIFIKFIHVLATTHSKSLKAGKVFIFQYLSFYEKLKFEHLN